MAHRNKDEIRVYYEANKITLIDLSKLYNVPYRTIARWAQKEGWVSGGAIENIKVENSDILQKEYNALIDMSKNTIKDTIKKNLGERAYRIDDVILDNLLDESTDKILLNTMTINYLQKNAALSVLLARDELMHLIREARARNKTDPMIIACAEKVAKLFLELQKEFYGADIKIHLQNKNTDLSSLSDEELCAMLESIGVVE